MNTYRDDTDTARVDRIVALLSELGDVHRAEHANGDRVLHETGDRELAIYCYGMAEAYRLAARHIRRALQTDYPMEAL